MYPWQNNRRFNSYATYCIKTFGTRLQKLSIDAGFTCPNRDGTLGSGGCTFCLNEGFNPSYCSPEKSITQQINEGIEFHRTRYSRAVKYLAYFQPYSNTYASLEKLKSAYSEALSHPQSSGLSIGTRPDCVSDEMLDYFKELSAQHFISIEYGIESCYNKTLKRVNRGHTFEQAKEMVNKTAAHGIHTGAHFMFGLPGESDKEMLDEAAIISELPLTSVKFHQLQILKGTEMEKEYLQNPEQFKLFSLEEYIDFMIHFLEQLRPSLLIERMTAEVPPRFLAGPGWGLIRSDQILQKIENSMEELDTWQGKYFKSASQK
jgi:uncharacterized protein